jgi:hypothetical protein
MNWHDSNDVAAFIFGVLLAVSAAIYICRVVGRDRGPM